MHSTAIGLIRREFPSLDVQEHALSMHARLQRSTDSSAGMLSSSREAERRPVSEDLVRRVVEAMHRPARPNGSEAPRPDPTGRDGWAGPTEDEIRERAYQIYLERHGAPGDPRSDWLRAERELREAYDGNGSHGSLTGRDAGARAVGGA